MNCLPILLIILALTACKSAEQPVCDTEGVPLAHQTNKIFKGPLQTRGSEYHVSLEVNGTPVIAIADTGSSNLDLASGQNFTPSGQSIGTYSIMYGAGGNNTIDGYHGTVGLNCLNQTAIKPVLYGYIQPGSAQNENILGLAYRGKELYPAGYPPEHAFFGQLVNQTAKTSTPILDEFAMLLCGVNNANSKINFGGTSSAFQGTFVYTPTIDPSYYVINTPTVSINGNSMGSFDSTMATIVDSGTTLNLVPNAVLCAIVAQIESKGGAGITGIDCKNNSKPTGTGKNISCPENSALANLPDVDIAIGNPSTTLSIKPSTYFKKLDNGQCFFGFGSNAGVGLNILGQVTMENYYVHFDRKNTRIGFGSNAMCGNQT
ncbi:MAG: pepsin-like aspartyl protease [Myxococcota bacterium]